MLQVVGVMRSLRERCISYGFRINLVAPWFSKSNINNSTPDRWDRLKALGHPINESESIGLAVCYLAGDNSQNGKGIFVCNNAFVEMEDKITELRPQWLGKWNSETFEVISHNKDYFFGGL